MTDLQALLDQIDQLDQQATKGPWENIGPTIESNGTYEDVITTEVDCSSYCYGGRGGGVLKDKDAEFIALARTFAPAAAKALRTILTECESFEIAHDDEDNPFHQGVHWTVMAIRQAITDALEADDA